MSSYHNEIDPYAAQWLRDLMAARLIPGGEVDERSIRDVQPDDLRGFVQCHFFAGLGGWPYALRLAGWPDDRAIWTGSCPCRGRSDRGVHGVRAVTARIVPLNRTAETIREGLDGARRAIANGRLEHAQRLVVLLRASAEMLPDDLRERVTSAIDDVQRDVSQAFEARYQESA